MPGRLVFSTTADGASTPTERMRIDSAGSVGIGGAGSNSFTLNLTRIPTATTSWSAYSDPTISATVTTYNGYESRPSTIASAFTVGTLQHYVARQGTIGASSAVTNQFGYVAHSSLTGATNNYGFYSDIASGTGRFNFYANGTAQNYLAGVTGVGLTPPASPGVSQIFANGDISMSGNSRGILGNLYYQGGWKYVADGYAWGINDSSGALVFNLAGHSCYHCPAKNPAKYFDSVK
jgi:hypothetical protein